MLLTATPGIAASPGDLVFFWGTGPLSRIIRLFTGGGPSHVAMIIDPALVTDDGAGQGGPYIAESTILHGVDGVQINSLPLRIGDYDQGGAIAIARLSPGIRALLDFPELWALLYARVDRDRYEKLELLAYVARFVPILDRIPQWNNPHQEVCSELIAMMLSAARLPGLDPYRTSPRTLLEMQMYSGIDWLQGKPQNLGKFNSK